MFEQVIEVARSKALSANDDFTRNEKRQRFKFASYDIKLLVGKRLSVRMLAFSESDGLISWKIDQIPPSVAPPRLTIFK